MIITTYDKKEYFVDDQTGQDIQQALKHPNPPAYIDIYGDGRDLVASKNISGVISDKAYDIKFKLEAPKLPEYEMTDNKERWYKVLRLNKQRIAKLGAPHKRLGLIKNLQELERYEVTGEWPEYEAPKVKPEKTIVVGEDKQPIGWRYSRNKYGEYMTKNQARDAEVHPMSSLDG